MIFPEFVVLFLIVATIGCFLFNGFLVLYFAFHSVLPVSFGGAFYAKSKHETIEKMVLLSEVTSKQKVVDLGSGDGRLVIAFAKRGAEAHGYEINPFLVWLSRNNIKKTGVSGRAFIHGKNFWSADFSEFDVVSVFGISYMMARLEDKLKKELRPGAKVLLNHFAFPKWQHSKKEGDVYLYIK